MKGFDAEFRDLDHYIRVITARIWEGGDIDAIRDYYAADCAVITPSGATTRVEEVMQGTRETLAQFPDRRLLAEDVVVAGDDASGWLSSHRIISTMTHRGAGAFGAPTGRSIQVRTVADCVCRDNRIVHEWLVRDQAAIAIAIGASPRALAQRWVDARLTPMVSTRPAAPAWWRDPWHATPAARVVEAMYRAIWSNDDTAIARNADDAIDWRGPGNAQHYGHMQVAAFWSSLTTAFAGATWRVESLVEHARPGRLPVVAMRWRLRGTHVGDGRFGEPTQRPVDVLGITHAELVHDRVLREWVLIDEVALWMQLLSPSASQAAASPVSAGEEAAP